MKLKSGSAPRCPECDDEWEGVVDDYVIPNRTGINSEAAEECVGCGLLVSVVRDPDGSFDLSIVEEDDSDD